MTKTINPENWVDDEVTYSVKNNTLYVFDEEFPITKTDLEDDTVSYSLKTVGITAFDWGNGRWEAFDEMMNCGRTVNDPIEALVKVLANIY